MANPSLEIGAITDPGVVRDQNEDVFGYYPTLAPEVLEQKGALYVVADGMGGYQAGEVASELAVREVLQRYYADPSPDVGTALNNAMHAAHEQIHQEAAQRHTPGMGTTIVAAVVRGGEVVVANVGDSPGYFIRQGQVQTLSEEHSWVAMALSKGLITPEQARDHPNRNVVTRSLGMDRPLEVYVSPPLPLEPGDVLLLCSDGLSNMVSEEEAAKIVADPGRPPQEAAQELVNLARERGAPDNVTALILRVGRPAGVPIRRALPALLSSRRLAVVVGAVSLVALVLLALVLWPRETPEQKVQRLQTRAAAAVAGTQGAQQQTADANNTAAAEGNETAQVLAVTIQADQTRVAQEATDAAAAIAATESARAETEVAGSWTATPIPTPVPPTPVPPTQARPTAVPPTDVPPTVPAQPTAVLPTDVPPTDVPPTDVPPTDVPPTDIPPTDVPPTGEPPTTPQRPLSLP